MRKLSSIIGTESESDDDDSDGFASVPALESSIEQLEDEGIWEKEPNDADVRVFGHDKIQSAAFELIPPTRETASEERSAEFF